MWDSRPAIRIEHHGPAKMGKNRAPAAAIAELAAASRGAARQSRRQFGLFCATDGDRIVAIACTKHREPSAPK
jgi:hypothetical protein